MRAFQTMLPLLAGAFKCRNKLQGFEGPAGALPPGGMATTGATTTGGWVPGFWTIGLGASAPPALAISEDRLASVLAGACLGADPVATSMNWSMICPSAGESAWPNLQCSPRLQTQRTSTGTKLLVASIKGRA